MCSVFVENDLGEIQYQMIHSFDDNAYYEVDFQHGGVLRHDTLVESVLSPDSGREKSISTCQ